MHYNQLFPDLPNIPFDADVCVDDHDESPMLGSDSWGFELNPQPPYSVNLADFPPEYSMATTKMIHRFVAPSKDDPFVPISSHQGYRPFIPEGLVGPSMMQSETHPSWHPSMFPQRQSSPDETIRSSISSNSSVYSYHGSFECSTVDAQPKWSIAPHIHSYEEYQNSRRFFNPPSDPCINLRDIQSFSDEECLPVEPDYMSGGSLLECYNAFPEAREYENQYVAERELDRVQDGSFYAEDEEAESYPSDENDSDYKPKGAGINKRGRTYRDHYEVVSASRTRHGKRPSTASQGGTKKSMKLSGNGRHTSNHSPTIKKGVRPFSCPLTPYGCMTTFTSKNEWKRHIVSQHLCLGFWRCALCPDADTRPNDFNRKDLFTQHLRRMHLNSHSGITALQPKPGKGNQGPSKAKSKNNRRSSTSVEQSDEALEKELEEIRQRCWVQRRNPPSHSCCAFCKETFEGTGSWDAWLEHTGRHLVAAAKQRQQQSNSHQSSGDKGDQVDTAKWIEDGAFREWLLHHGLLVPGDRKNTWALPDKDAHNDVEFHDVHE